MAVDWLENSQILAGECEGGDGKEEGQAGLSGGTCRF